MERPDGAYIADERVSTQYKQTVRKLGGVDSGAAAGAISLGMTHIAGHDRSQTLLLPETLDEYVGAATRRGSSRLSSMGLIWLRRGSPVRIRTCSSARVSSN